MRSVWAFLAVSAAGCGTNDDAPLSPGPADASVDGAVSMPDGGSDGSTSFRDWRPDRKGLWIWYFDYIGMTPAEAAAKAQTLGVGYVLIKSGQDAAFWSQRFNAGIVNEFKSRGMRVLAWPYVTPADVPGSITAAIAAANVPGADGVVLDVEVEWEKGDNKAAAATLCDGIREKVPGVFLGYTSFGWVGFHTAFPFAAFDAHCGDSAWPQVYYSDRGVKWDGTSGLTQALAHYKDAGLKAPMWPIQSNDDVSGTTSGPTLADLNGFFDTAGPYASLWEFPEASKTEKVDQMPWLHWKNP